MTTLEPAGINDDPGETNPHEQGNSGWPSLPRRPRSDDPWPFPAPGSVSMQSNCHGNNRVGLHCMNQDAAPRNGDPGIRLEVETVSGPLSSTTGETKPLLR